MFDLPFLTVVSQPIGVSQPQAGYYRRLSPLYFRDRWNGNHRRKPNDGDWLPVIIWHGAPCDPETGELLDRSYRWQCLVAGNYADPYEQWTWCCGNPATALEYQEMVEVVRGLPCLADIETMVNEDDNGQYAKLGDRAVS